MEQSYRLALLYSKARVSFIFHNVMLFYSDFKAVFSPYAVDY